MGSIQAIHQSLNRLAESSIQMPLALEKDKWIVFSDHHCGIGDGADDFAICKESYLSTLSYYNAEEFGLIILGDAEEFWENTLKNVITRYRKVLNDERKFFLRGKLIKIWGNHDDAWNHLQEVKKHLFPYFDNINTHEGVRFQVTQDSHTLG
jgi:metallophosphoesterase superfamily enzyme